MKVEDSWNPDLRLWTFYLGSFCTFGWPKSDDCVQYQPYKYLIINRANFSLTKTKIMFNFEKFVRKKI